MYASGCPAVASKRSCFAAPTQIATNQTMAFRCAKALVASIPPTLTDFAAHFLSARPAIRCRFLSRYAFIRFHIPTFYIFGSAKLCCTGHFLLIFLRLQSTYYEICFEFYPRALSPSIMQHGLGALCATTAYQMQKNRWGTAFLLKQQSVLNE